MTAVAQIARRPSVGCGGRSRRRGSPCGVVLPTRASCSGLLERPEVRSASLEQSFFEGFVASGEHISRKHFEVALLDSAIAAYSAKLTDERASFFASAARGRPMVQPESRRAVELRLRGDSYRFQVQQLGPRDFRLDGEGVGPSMCTSMSLARLERRHTFGAQHFHVVAVQQGTTRLVEVGERSTTCCLDAARAWSARPRRPWCYRCQPPWSPRRGRERPAILESMKMEMAVVAPFAGRVREVLVNGNVQVHAGAPLVLLEPSEHASNGEPATTVHFDGVAVSRFVRSACQVGERVSRGQAAASRFRPRRGRRQARICRVERVSQSLAAEDPDLLRAEQQVLAAFADIHSLFRRQPSDDEPDGEEDRSTHEYFVTYLRAIDAAGDKLPPSFRGKLRARCRTTASTGGSARPSSRKPSSGSTSPMGEATSRRSSLQAPSTAGCSTCPCPRATPAKDCVTC